MQINTFLTRNRLAVNQGIVFGTTVGVLLIIYLLADYIIYNAILTLILGIVTFLIELGLYAVAGYRTSAITDKTGTGAIAGLFAGLIGGLIGAVVSIILLFAYLDITHVRVQSFLTTAAQRQSYTNTYIISTGLTAAVAGLILAIGYGAGMGAIGGLIARRRASQAQLNQETASQETPQEDVV